ncbi:MAG TPA: hypothetical protein VMV81_04450 [Phycisphaerae bacterium]|nr:hypothetical protein [Phycisphaerae bacterium]
MSGNNQQTTADPFSTFWTEFFSRMGAQAPSMGTMPSPGPDAMKQMQRVFLDAMAKYCDDYMRSEQFLQMMKQTMDRSLAFKQQLDQFLGAAQKGMQSPARSDIDDLSGTLLKIEERVLDRLDALEKKVAAVEGSRRSSPKGEKPKRPARRVSKKRGR